MIGIDRHVDQIDVQHPGCLRNRRMGLGRRGDLPACRSHAPSSRQRRVTGGMQSREIAERPARHKGASGLRREAGEIGQPAQRFVLGVDRSGRFQPAAGVDPGGSHQQIEEDRDLRRRVGDEGEVARMVGRNRRRRQLLDPAPERL